MHDAESAKARVLEILRAGQRLADPRDPLGHEARERLPDATGLSAAGVELALTEHLESEITDSELTQLIASVEPATTIHVVLSANVFTAAMRAIALAAAGAPNVRVRPSSREPVFAELLLRAHADQVPGEEPEPWQTLLPRARADEPNVGSRQVTLQQVDTLDPEPGDRVHVYGHDTTIDAFRAALEPEIPVWGHGAGLGVAVVDASAIPSLDAPSGVGKSVGRGTGDVIEAATLLARDMVPFDQRGCLSPRIVLFHGDDTQLDLFVEALEASLLSWEARVPVGLIDDDDRMRRRSYLDVMSVVGEAIEVGSGGVGVDRAPQTLTLPGSPRMIHVARVSDAQDAKRLVLPMSESITAIGGAGLVFAALRAAIPGARGSALGWMQRPRLDGPVDRRGGKR